MDALSFACLAWLSLTSAESITQHSPPNHGRCPRGQRPAAGSRRPIRNLVRPDRRSSRPARPSAPRRVTQACETVTTVAFPLSVCALLKGFTAPRCAAHCSRCAHPQCDNRAAVLHCQRGKRLRRCPPCHWLVSCPVAWTREAAHATQRSASKASASADVEPLSRLPGWHAWRWPRHSRPSPRQLRRASGQRAALLLP